MLTFSIALPTLSAWHRGELELEVVERPPVAIAGLAGQPVGDRVLEAASWRRASFGRSSLVMFDVSVAPRRRRMKTSGRGLERSA